MNQIPPLQPYRLLDPRFKYVPSHQTDIRKTFAAARQQLQNTPPKEPA